jgi:hypothetical protein
VRRTVCVDGFTAVTGMIIRLIGLFFPLVKKKKKSFGQYFQTTKRKR